MAAGLQTPSPGADRHWFIVGRWQEYEGEARANLLRVLGIVLFYLVELVNYHGLHLGPLEMPAVVDRRFHLAVTALAVAWTMVALGVFLCRRQHVFPASLKYLSTGCDVVFLTAILTAADGPRSPLVVSYFLVIALAALRFSLPLIWFATAAAAGGYLFLLAYASWFTDRDIRVPRYSQAILLLALVLTGVVLGQIIRRVRWLADEYARRLQGTQGGRP
jgi:hypothetical protein